MSLAFFTITNSSLPPEIEEAEHKDIVMTMKKNVFNCFIVFI
ncbi:hypothetical protein FPSM_01956 [Flavobacterium psychrophilum]|nr:hypothetical protein FPSM_01956 [Flavobacterium psychrophilum]